MVQQLLTVAVLFLVGCGSTAASGGAPLDVEPAAADSAVTVDSGDTLLRADLDDGMAASDAATDSVQETTGDALGDEVATDVLPDVLPDVSGDTDGMTNVDTPVGCEPADLPPPPVATNLEGLDLTRAGIVRGVYFAPADRPFSPGLHQRLDTWIRLAQAFFRDEMASHGHISDEGDGLTFPYEVGPDGRFDVVYMVGAHPASFYHEHASAPDALGEALAEIFQRLPPEFHNNNVTAYVVDTAVIEGDVLIHTGQGGSLAPWEGEGAGYVLQGAHFLGVGFETVAVDPDDQVCLFEQPEPSGLSEWDEASAVVGPISRGVYASVMVGASFHELGHAFGLGHIFSDSDGDGVENNLMGNGFRRLRGRYTPLGLTPATILAPESAEALLGAVPFGGF